MKKMIIIIFCCCLLLAGSLHVFAAQPGEDKKDSTIKLSSGSIGWHAEQFKQWIIATGNLVPKEEQDTDSPPFVINSLKLSGSVDKNAFSFEMKGSVIAKKPVLVPLFGPSDKVMLTGVTIDGQPALLGFKDTEHYFVKTGKRNFTIRGQLSLLDRLSLDVVGPVNYFWADLSSGRVVEGNRIPGLKGASLHLETGERSKTVAVEKTPFFQMSRAIRIQKEINFRYRVTLENYTDTSTIEIPLKFSEIVQDVPGVKGWKLEKGKLVVPISGKDSRFDIIGRLPQTARFSTDERSSYEWWLIESDSEHLVNVSTTGKFVDVSKSPIGKKLPSSELYLLSKGQELSLKVSSLTAIDALAVVVKTQFRKVVWSKSGQLLSEDIVNYRNNGLSYLPFECKGKPLYFEADDRPQVILSQDPANESQILVPMETGDHSFTVQSARTRQPSLLVGSLEIPEASHSLLTSRSSIRLGLPEGIIPVYFSGGERVGSLVQWRDIAFLAISVLLAFLFFKGTRERVAAVIVFGGLYLVFPLVLGVACFLIVCVSVLLFLRSRVKRWVVKTLLVFFLIGGVLLLMQVNHVFDAVELWRHAQGMSTAGSGGVAYNPMYAHLPEQEKFENAHGGREDFQDIERDTIYRRSARSQAEPDMEYKQRPQMEQKNILRGVIPVHMPRPDFERSVTITKELVTKENPLTLKMFYITRLTLVPFYLLWLAGIIVLGYLKREKLLWFIDYTKGLWIKKELK